MAIYRVPRTFSIWSDTVHWGKKFTLKFPIGDNSRLYILWPGTLVGAALGAFIGIMKKIKGNHSQSSSRILENIPYNIRHKLAGEKRFSEIPTNDDLYIEEIPGYKKLIALHSYNNQILKNLSENAKNFIYEYFPSFLNVVEPSTIKKLRTNHIKDENDYSEILLVFGGELIYVWDFDTKSWYFIDKTFNPAKEWRIKDNNIFESLKQIFNPEYNELLSKRLDVWENMQDEKNLEMRRYIEMMLSAIDTIKD